MKRIKLSFESTKNFAFACFFCWLIFSPVSKENINQPPFPPSVETSYLRGGGKEDRPPVELPPLGNSNNSVTSPTPSPKVSGSESESFPAESERVTFKPGSGNNPGGSGNDDLDMTIGTKN